MKKFLLILCLVTALSLCATAFAASGLLTDRADLLDSWEEADLLEDLEELWEETGVAVVVVTVDSLDGKTVRAYAEDWFDYGGYGEDGILLLIDMDSRQWYICTTGYGMAAVTDAEVDSIGEDVAYYLSDEEYSEAIRAFADACRAEIGSAPSREAVNASAWAKTLGICLLIGFAISLIVVLCLKGQLKSVRFKPNAQSYVVPGSMHVTRSHDIYLYSSTVRTARPKNNSSGGSSGRSHGGGGGRF